MINIAEGQLASSGKMNAPLGGVGDGRRGRANAPLPSEEESKTATIYDIHSILVYDTLLSPTIMGLRRPRREEGGRGGGLKATSEASFFSAKGDLKPISEVRRSESYHYTLSRLDDDEEGDDDGCGRGGGRSGGLPEFVSLTL